MAESNHVTWILASHWIRVVTWPGYWPLIGRLSKIFVFIGVDAKFVYEATQTSSRSMIASQVRFSAARPMTTKYKLLWADCWHPPPWGAGTPAGPGVGPVFVTKINKWSAAWQQTDQTARVDQTFQLWLIFDICGLYFWSFLTPRVTLFTRSEESSQISSWENISLDPPTEIYSTSILDTRESKDSGEVSLLDGWINRLTDQDSMKSTNWKL